MNTTVIYGIIFVILLILELLYFKIGDKYNIIDKPNERSSHSTIVLRGGGIIFLFGVWIWSLFFGFPYPWVLAAVTIVAGVSFVDDIQRVHISVRLVAQFSAMIMMFHELGMLHLDMWWAVILALIVCVGATNIYNFMDGINGITGGYSLAVIVPLMLKNGQSGFMEQSFLMVATLAAFVFCIFNFHPRGKAKCFAGDVGSVGMAFILLFSIGKLVMITNDITWLMLLIVYGVDGCLTIVHRIMLHENLGKAHRKHAYQIMANELGMNHVTVSSIYMLMQLVISIMMVYVIPDTVLAHWLYFATVLVVLSLAYIVFMKKYYYLHEEYLASLKKE